MSFSMTRPAILVALAAGALVGCKGGGAKQSQDLKPCDITVSSQLLEFGELAQGDSISRTITLTNDGQVSCGIQSLGIASDTDAEKGVVDAYKIHYNIDDMVLPDCSSSADGGSTARGHDKPLANGTDTAGGDTGIDTGDTNSGDTDQGGPTDSQFALVLPAGAHIPITITFTPKQPQDNYDALIVTTADKDYSNQDTPPPAEQKIYRDPDQTWQMVYLHGAGEEKSANIVVTPKNIDFGFVWPGQTVHKYVAIKNVGDGDLTLNHISLSSDCSPGFSIATAPKDKSIVEGQTSTVLGVDFAPVGDDVDEARCTVTVESSDLDAPSQEISLVANSGKDPNNHSPTVQILWPPPGYQVQGWSPIKFELRVYDPDQPEDTLVCKVKSSLQLGASLTSCTPTDESGHYFVDVPIEDLLDPGLDVFTVTVTDKSEVTRKASVPLLINATYPSDDDDGDGFGVGDPDHPDCNDHDINTYPYASEIYDGHDNDCDLQVDEGTDGADDDGDGMSEVAGDCDDNNPNTYLGAPEQQDNADNDCDGVIDEQTSAYDDDGDGFAELDLDCNDSDPTINPASVEICGDGRDNNCNGLKDSAEPCVATDSAPMIVGGINESKTAVEVGESTQLSVLIYEADGDIITNAWSVKDNAGLIDDPASPTINWTAPDQIEGSDDGQNFRVSYVGVDDDGNQVWAFGEVSVYQKGKLHGDIFVSPDVVVPCPTPME